MAEDSAYGMYEYQNFQSTGGNPNDKFGALPYYHNNRSFRGLSVLDIFNVLTEKPYMSFTSWGVTDKNRIGFGLFQSSSKPYLVYVIYIKQKKEYLKVEGRAEVSEKIESEVISSKRPMEDPRFA